MGGISSKLKKKNTSKDEEMSGEFSYQVWEMSDDPLPRKRREPDVRFSGVQQPKRLSQPPHTEAHSHNGYLRQKDLDLGRGDYCDPESVYSYGTQFRKHVENAYDHSDDRKSYKEHRNNDSLQQRSGCQPTLYVDCYKEEWNNSGSSGFQENNSWDLQNSLQSFITDSVRRQQHTDSYLYWQNIYKYPTSFHDHQMANLGHQTKSSNAPQTSHTSNYYPTDYCHQNKELPSYDRWEKNSDYPKSESNYQKYFYNVAQQLSAIIAEGEKTTQFPSLPLPWHIVAKDQIKKYEVQRTANDTTTNQKLKHYSFIDYIEQREKTLTRTVIRPTMSMRRSDGGPREEVNAILMVNYEQKTQPSFHFTVTVISSGETNVVDIHKDGLRVADAPSFHQFILTKSDSLKSLQGAIEILEFLSNKSDENVKKENALPNKVALLFAEIIKSSGCETKTLTINSTKLTDSHSILVKSFKPTKRLEIHIQDLVAPYRVLEYFCLNISLEFTMISRLDLIFIVRSVFEEWLNSTRKIETLDITFPKRGIFFTVDFLQDFVEKPRKSPNKIRRLETSVNFSLTF